MMDNFTQGYMCALATMIRLNGCIDGNAKEIFGCNSCTVEQLIEKGVDSEVIELIKPLAIDFEKINFS